MRGAVKRLAAAGRWGMLLVVTLLVAYGVLLLYPQPLFAHELRHEGIVLHATRPIPGAMHATLRRVQARLDRSPVYSSGTVTHVFICEPRWLFALFARNNYRAGGIANAYLRGHVFLRESDMDRDRLIGPSGQPVPVDRPLSYFIAHELMHVAIARTLGPWRYSRLPRWVDDGYADYVARDIDLGEALQGFKEGRRELAPERSGLYVRYHLMVAHALEKSGLTPRALLETPPEGGDVERQLLALVSW